MKVADISARLGVTKQNVFKVVHLLSHAGYLTAVRGPNGGVRLAKPANEIRVGDVVRTIEVTRVTVDGSSDTKAADSSSGSLNAMFDDALTAFISVLDQHSLAELAAARNFAADWGDSPSSKSGMAKKARSRTKSVSTRAARRS